MKANNIRKISNTEKVLLRPNRFIGATDIVTEERYRFDGSKIIKGEVSYVPGLIKIIREVIDNSIDEGIRTNFKHANKIDIVIEDGVITIADNGRGIPIKPIEGHENILMPEGAWTELNTGSNFDDEEDNLNIGQNGEGVALTCILSEYFKGITINDGKCFTLEAFNNLSSKKISISNSNKPMGTCVIFKPDYNRLHLSEFTKVHQDILAYDLINLALIYPNIKFTLNKKQFKLNTFKDYVELFNDYFTGKAEIVEQRGLKIAVMNNSEDMFGFVHFINGINVNNGGKPLTWAINNIVNLLTTKIEKKYKNIKSGDVKNKLFVIVMFDGMFKPRFEDQIKSVCSNTYISFKTQIDEPDWDKFVDKIFKNKDIIDPITEVYKIKEELKKRQEMKGLEKTKKKIKSEKYLPAIGQKKYLFIVEGQSACGGLIPVLGRKDASYYSLKGKPMNVLTATHEKFRDNKELTELYQIIKNEFELEDMPDGDFYEITIGGETMIVNENDTVLINGEWIEANKLIKKESK